MAKRRSSDAFYALDDLLEAAGVVCSWGMIKKRVVEGAQSRKLRLNRLTESCTY